MKSNIASYRVMKYCNSFKLQKYISIRCKCDRIKCKFKTKEKKVKKRNRKFLDKYIKTRIVTKIRSQFCFETFLQQSINCHREIAFLPLLSFLCHERQKRLINTPIKCRNEVNIERTNKKVEKRDQIFHPINVIKRPSLTVIKLAARMKNTKIINVLMICCLLNNSTTAARNFSIAPSPPPSLF